LERLLKKGKSVRCTIKKVIYFSCVFVFAAYGHGFGPHTLIQLTDGSQDTIYSVCLRALQKPISVASYDISHACTIDQPVVTGKRSTTNCYIQLSFDNRPTSAHDIVSTPTQEFYVLALNQWVPAYLLQTGDALLTKKMTVKPITRKNFVSESLNIYMLEIASSHTFFVGKHAILTHNIFLPVALNLGFVVPFGGVASGAVGSFFGPIGLVGGAIFGGVIGIAIKAFCKKRISRYETPVFNIAYLQNSCHNIALSKDDRSTVPSGCFTVQNLIDISCAYPIENPLPQIQAGCVEIEISVANDHITNFCSKSHDQATTHNSGCFEPNPHNQEGSGYSQGKNAQPENKGRYNGPTARNWKEFEGNCPIGQKYGKKFVHTGIQNPKDGSPVRKLSEDIPNTEMFKKGYHFALDKFHDGDHFEVWNKRKEWIGVANLDGSENKKKTNAETDKKKRNLPT
jgi:hypothetical protein